ncbi:MAG: hypothetical protein FD126_2522 [Elusimicrobia bacterium]|nr:MAG: hypothetical protein FD126_2522 [Elusimicrobiota bacterium]
MTLAGVFLALACVPAGAAGYAERRGALTSQYLAEARARLAEARGYLENIQELMLTPHSSDGPAEAALLHLDLAAAALEAAEPTLARLPSSEPPPGWTPFEARLGSARKLLRSVAPDLEAVYDRVPVSVGPLESNIVGFFEGSIPRVTLRGYYALSGSSPEYLATLLAHEAAHAHQWEAAHARGEKFAASREEEAEARRREAAVWKALGSPRKKDSDGAAAIVAAAVEAGEASLLRHIDKEEEQARDWEWVTPAVPAPPRPDAAAQAVPEPEAEDDMSWLDGRIAGIRSDFSHAALARLDGARAVLGSAVELAAPFPKIVNFELVQVWALTPKRYPPGIHAAFQALHPAMTEIDKARAALALPDASPEDRALLARYAADRAVLRPWTESVASTPVADPPPHEGDRLVVPGAWVDRSTNADVAAAWGAHVTVHRGQGVLSPSLEQEAAAVEASLEVWAKLGADARFDKAHPDRFLRFRVARQEGGREALRSYLRGLGFAD